MIKTCIDNGFEDYYDVNDDDNGDNDYDNDNDQSLY